MKYCLGKMRLTFLLWILQVFAQLKEFQGRLAKEFLHKYFAIEGDNKIGLL